MRLSKIVFKILAVFVFGWLFWEGRAVERLIFTVTAVPAYGFGYFIFRNPTRMFEIQRNFYARINWRIEPISLEKEIRNTRGMGITVMVIVLGAALYVVLTGFVFKG